jgi:hypothetical protein
VFEGNQLIAVLYFFSTEPQVFPNAADPKSLAETGEVILHHLKVAGVL